MSCHSTLENSVTTSIILHKTDAVIAALECNDRTCRELTTLWVARLDDGAELKVTDPKEQHRDVDEEEAEDEERRERVDCRR